MMPSPFDAQMFKSFQLRGLPETLTFKPGTVSLKPAGGSAPDRRYRLTLPRSPRTPFPPLVPHAPEVATCIWKFSKSILMQYLFLLRRSRRVLSYDGNFSMATLCIF